MLFDLTENVAGQQDIAGGKAAGLHKLIQAGVPTPPGLVLTVEAHRRFLKAVSGAVDKRPVPEMAAEETSRAELFAAHHSVALPESVESSLREANERMSARGQDNLAVRSSAVGEDDAQQSMAGLHESRLEVSPDQLEEAVRECWASLWSKRAVAGRSAADTSEPAMALVVQPVIDASASAVVFTRDPIQHADLLRVEAVRGMGEPLVSGQVTPETHVLDRITLAPADDAEPEAQPVLPHDTLVELGELALRVERYFGCALDLEVTFDSDGELWFVQARHITTSLASRRCQPGDVCAA